MSGQITFLQAVNRVLRRLREKQVTTVSGASAYVELIKEFVNESVQEVEAAWQWNSKHSVLQLTMVPGTNVYSLTGFGDEFVIQLVYNTTKNFPVKGPYRTDYLVATAYSSIDTTSAAWSFTFYGKDSNGDPQIRVYPTPGEPDVWEVHAKIRTGYLVSDSDVIHVPWRPVVLGAVVKAVSERGEDGGAAWDEVNRSYELALADAIGYDANGDHSSKDWCVD